mgnify:CR=1 FL=1
MRVESILAEAGAALVAVGIHNGRQEACWLLAHVLAHLPPECSPCTGGSDLAAEAEARFQALLLRRVGGEPLQYVMGSAEFYGLELAVGPGVLAPRPETERLVDFALEMTPGEGAMCDLCTGSGAIALALAHERGHPERVWATDISSIALEYARSNAARLGLPIHLVQGDLFTPLPEGQRFALITANPPYVTPAEYDDLPPEVRDYEPKLALWADDAGLAVLRRIATESAPWLAPGAWVLCEIGSEQGEAARGIFAAAGFVGIEIRQDYTQRDRVVVARWHA